MLTVWESQGQGKAWPFPPFGLLSVTPVQGAQHTADLRVNVRVGEFLHK